MEFERGVRITSGCPNHKSWGLEGVVLKEYMLNNSKHLLVSINNDWLLVNEVFTESVNEQMA